MQEFDEIMADNLLDSAISWLIQAPISLRKPWNKSAWIPAPYFGLSDDRNSLLERVKFRDVDEPDEFLRGLAESKSMLGHRVALMEWLPNNWPPHEK
jgi:hypothetical protein